MEINKEKREIVFTGFSEICSFMKAFKQAENPDKKTIVSMIWWSYPSNNSSESSEKTSFRYGEYWVEVSYTKGIFGIKHKKRYRLVSIYKPEMEKEYLEKVRKLNRKIKKEERITNTI